MSVHFELANVLLEQSRPDLAEKELRHGLAEDPNNARAHALLALCMLDKKDLAAAMHEATAAVQLDPGLSFAHYAIACVLARRNCFGEALPAIMEALRLQPENPHYFAKLAEIRFEQRDWQSALDAAEMGLKIDAEDVGCNNLRAMALVKLGRKHEAGQTLDAALARDPHDPITHVNLGWALLERREPRKALEHFREALRLDPNMSSARAGIVEALKARFLIYRALLAYFLWMAKLSRGKQWAVVFGGLIGYQLVRQLAESNPQLLPWLRPLMIAYVVFALMTWLGVPLANLLLRLNKFGRLVLSHDQRVASNWIALCLTAALGSFIWWLCVREEALLFGAMVMGLLCIPMTAIFVCDKGWPRTTMILYTLGLAIAGIGSIALLLEAERTHNRFLDDLGNGASLVFLVGFLISQFLANGLAMARPRR